MSFGSWLKARFKVPTKENPNTYYAARPFRSLDAIPAASVMLVSHAPEGFFLDTIGWAIRWVTRSPVCHAMIYLGNGWLVEAAPEGGYPLQDCEIHQHQGHDMGLRQSHADRIPTEGDMPAGDKAGRASVQLRGPVHLYGRPSPRA